MDGRNFLRAGGMTAPDGADNKSAVAAAINHFGVTEADLRKVMATALEKGGDYADLILSIRSITM